MRVLSTKPNGDHSEETLRPTYEDAFTLEYRGLYAAIVDGKPVKTGPLDGMSFVGRVRCTCPLLATNPEAREDLVLFKMIMEAL